MSETLRDIPSEVRATQPDLEAELSASGVIDPHDHLFRYVYDEPRLLDKSQALASYLSAVAYLRTFFATRDLPLHWPTGRTQRRRFPCWSSPLVTAGSVATFATSCRMSVSCRATFTRTS
jgi:hypothetical protein